MRNEQNGVDETPEPEITKEQAEAIDQEVRVLTQDEVIVATMVKMTLPWISMRQALDLIKDPDFLASFNAVVEAVNAEEKDNEEE